MPCYPVKITPGEEGRVLVTFPDVPEAVVCAESEEDAMRRAPAILGVILQGYRSERRPIPEPSEAQGAPVVATEP